MYSKSGRVFDFTDLSYDVKKKGLAPLIRDIEGLEVKIRYILNYKHFVINYRTRNVDHNVGNLYITDSGSYVT